jgi:hypothetical protein
MSQSGPQDAAFRRSSFSASDGGCVEMAAASGHLLVWDTKNRTERSCRSLRKSGTPSRTAFAQGNSTCISDPWKPRLT